MKLSQLITTTVLLGSMLITAQAHNHKAKADIVDTAVAAGNFTTLAAALTAAGLVETLDEGSAVWVCINGNHAVFTGTGKSHPDHRGHRGLTYATLLVGHRDDACRTVRSKWLRYWEVFQGTSSWADFHAVLVRNHSSVPTVRI